MSCRIYTIIIVFCLTMFGSSFAQPSQAAGASRYSFDTTTQATRFNAFTHEIRCLVCQNQSVAESNSMFSDDVKDWVYEAIMAGQTDYEIKMALVKRFGDSIFYTPPLQSNTYILWVMPLLLLFIGVLVFMFIIRRHKK